ncbi:SinI family restriction endonuclease [Flavobacterium sp. I-SCBP12n]|uniref:SinI family restriction endonuclease n=1 Tax=Flavobacterium pygoscelis TaxID=2893176 RepID=A0A9X2BLC8_9FLAO|nr:SinI family restriction endonuclease [Flavobacterium pygoscelis]MCK8142479.1 SinI family restriction endonuclease [Flavobacterium pygoscelis]
MNINTEFTEALEIDAIITYAKAHCRENYSQDLETLLKCAFSDIRNLPKLAYPKKIDKVEQQVPLKDYVIKFIDSYHKAYNNRPSLRVGNASKTFSDPIVGLIFSLRVEDTSAEELKKIVEGHSLQMSIENLIGDLLEEYLSIKLCDYGWVCCWGSSIDAVDFCNSDGNLLQVKNSDNSENSSSSRVRNGTEIKKWARRKSTQNNTFYWEKLKELTGIEEVSEEDFRVFVENTIKKNPECIYLQDLPKKS